MKNDFLLNTHFLFEQQILSIFSEKKICNLQLINDIYILRACILKYPDKMVNMVIMQIRIIC